MRYFILSVVLMLLASCGGGGGSDSSSTDTVPSITTQENLKLLNTTVLAGSIFYDGDFSDPDLKAEIRVKNESATNSYLCYIRYSHFYETGHIPPQVLLPGETGKFYIPLKDFLDGYINNLFLKIEVDYLDYVDETDETDNEIIQKILIYAAPPT